MLKLKRFHKATKDSWGTKPLESFSLVTLDIKLTSEEFELLSYGSIPESMDNHWFGYMENNQYYLFRSWTGTATHIIEFNVQSNGSVRAVIAMVVSWWRNFDSEPPHIFIEDHIKSVINRNKYYKFGAYENYLIKEFGKDKVKIIK
ncbi:MAG: hypothetical protein WC877_00910 [Dehalococcoidales bacterium]|jgi:hypothetical protein